MSSDENPSVTLEGTAASVETFLANAQRAMEKINQLAETAQQKVADITSVATLAIGAKTQINDEQAVIATKSDHIQKAQEHADKVRGDLDRVLTAASQQATEAEGQKSRAQSAADATAELLANIRTSKGSIDTDATTIASAKETATESAAQTKGLADKAATVEERIAAYEKRLAELESQSDAQLKTIIGLLPGATSAGLAYAFNERRQSFIKPSKRWQWFFVGSLLALVALATQGLWHVFTSGLNLTYDELLRLWLARLPVAGALVWLALHASRESALAKRLEEDYGYKSAVAATFLGFHKQMSEVGSAAASNEPLKKLCDNTLATVASPPGRIYERHKLTVSPTSELADAAKIIGDVTKNPVASVAGH
jgi:hypothetical protein